MIKNLKSANSAKIGKVFQVARNELSLSKKEVSDAAFINIRYIHAIETGDYSTFPSEVFAKAYFEKYQKFLSIDCDFPRIYEEHIKEDKLIQKSITKINPLPAPYFKILIVIVLILIAVILTNINTSVEPNSMLSSSEVNSVADKDFKNIKQVTNSINLIETSEDILNKLFISFSDECWIEIYSFDELIVNKLFQYGDNFEVEIDKPFKIVVGNAEAVEASYNGNNIDFIANANRLNVSTIVFNDE